MQINLDTAKGQYTINAYQPGQITINQTHYTHSVIISPNQLITTWQPQQVVELTIAAFDPVLALNPEIVLLGTGEIHQFPESKLFLPFIERQIGYEIMSTDAACRTYNVLMSEGRNVVAALLL